MYDGSVWFGTYTTLLAERKKAAAIAADFAPETDERAEAEGTLRWWDERLAALVFLISGAVEDRAKQFLLEQCSGDAEAALDAVAFVTHMLIQDALV